MNSFIGIPCCSKVCKVKKFFKRTYTDVQTILSTSNGCIYHAVLILIPTVR